MKVSVVIPTFNSKERLELTLKSLEQQTFPREDFEVVVVNDGSGDGTKEFLDHLSAGLNLKVIHQENRGQARARNAGIRVAKGDIIVFVDDDVFCVSDLVARHYERHASSNVPLAVIGKIMNISCHCFEEARLVVAQANYYDMDVLKPFFKQDAYLDMRTRVWEKNYRYVQWICLTAANASISAKTLAKTGEFDENFNGWGPEDIELGYRLFKQNVGITYDNTIVNYHFDKKKNTMAFYSKLAANLRYMKETKHKSAKEISNYILFIGDNMSLEELNHICSGSEAPFDPAQYEDLYFFGFLNYFGSKSQMG